MLAVVSTMHIGGAERNVRRGHSLSDRLSTLLKNCPMCRLWSCGPGISRSSTYPTLLRRRFSTSRARLATVGSAKLSVEAGDGSIKGPLGKPCLVAVSDEQIERRGPQRVHR